MMGLITAVMMVKGSSLAMVIQRKEDSNFFLEVRKNSGAKSILQVPRGYGLRAHLEAAVRRLEGEGYRRMTRGELGSALNIQ